MKVTVPSWITQIQIKNNSERDLKDEPILEEKFENILNELEGMKKETRCGTCKDTFGRMIETGKNYQKVQALITKMEERGHHSWSEIPESEKKKLKESVGIV